MRKALGLACLSCLLVVGLACSGDSSTPTAPAVENPALTSVTAGVAPDKDLICHRNTSEPDGVIILVGENAKRHFKHLATGQDCRSCEGTPGDTCDPDDSTLVATNYICNNCF